MNITWCKKCILPSTRPRLTIGPDGICSACKAVEENKAINWKGRQDEWRRLIHIVKSEKKPYDCLLPVSGGKDSTWQAVKVLEYGLRPLAFTWHPPGRTALGQKNLDNLINLGVTHVDFTINPQIEPKMYLRSLKKFGAMSCMHQAVFNSAMRFAYQFEIPLVIWSENSADVYTGGNDPLRGSTMTGEWVKVHGSTHGAKMTDWMDVSEGLTRQQLQPYDGPGDRLLAQRGIYQVFLGYFFKWDPQQSYEVARTHGFEAGQQPITGYSMHSDIDDPAVAAHHLGKAFKYLFTREFDNLSLEIRAGRLTRAQAIGMLCQQGGPNIHMPSIKWLCEYVNIEEEEFWRIMNKWRNKDLWKREGNRWVAPEFLIPEWDWGVIGADF